MVLRVESQLLSVWFRANQTLVVKDREWYFGFPQHQLQIDMVFLVPPISELKDNTYICVMHAPWVQCYTSRESWPQSSILHTRKDNLFVEIRTVG